MDKTPKYVNIVDNDSLVRDTFSRGILNTNTHALAASQRAYAVAMQKLAEQRTKDQQLNSLRIEVDELKQLVAKLLEKK